MKIAVSAMSGRLDAEVYPRIGRCQCFSITDSETMKFENLPSASAVKSLDDQLKEVKKTSRQEVILEFLFNPRKLKAYYYIVVRVKFWILN